MANSKFFTNTYVTGSGRQNFLRADYLEDPLFTSFTFDIDFISSPLFYTINNYVYPHPNNIGISEQIETALKDMHDKMSIVDQGYDILPLFSAEFLNGNKLGFGLQQNIYMDLPLYGAAEYIYMVDKRNGDGSQNDVRYNRGNSADNGGYKSYKLGDSVKEAVSKSDQSWVDEKKRQAQEQIKMCDEILGNESNKQNNSSIKADMNEKKKSYDNCTQRVDGVEDEFTEDKLIEIVEGLKKYENQFELFKKEIVDWANGILSGYQSRGLNIYNENKCLQKMATFQDLGEKNKVSYAIQLQNEFGEDFRKTMIHTDKKSYGERFKALYLEIETYDKNKRSQYWGINSDDGKSFLLDKDAKDSGAVSIRQSKIIEKFYNGLKYFDLLNEDSKSFKGDVKVRQGKEIPDWVHVFWKKASWFVGENTVKTTYEMSKALMSYQCDYELSFDKNFTSEKISSNNNMLGKYEAALDNIRTEKYGFEDGQICDKSNPTPDSLYGQYLEAKEKYENDPYTQAGIIKSAAQSELNGMESMTSNNGDDTSSEISERIPNTNIEESNIEMVEPIITPQTVLDMLGFIFGMRKMTTEYPYIIQGITGLDKAYETHYGVKDPYMGSGDNKIVLTCWESLDLRVTTMFNRYFNAVYDRQYRRERVPVNLRRFNCSVYVHDVRNFVTNNTNGKYVNRMLELTDMYYSAIEFKFYDCEIVPEETGNIFNDITNEAPTEMKKTNFTFTYGNCVVNFVPQSEVANYR